MSTVIRTDPNYNLVELQGGITILEKDNPRSRLDNLKGAEKEGVPFNFHTYERVENADHPFSKLFVIKDDEPAENDAAVKAWLELHKDQKIRSQEKVYISKSLTKIAVVN